MYFVIFVFAIYQIIFFYSSLDLGWFPWFCLCGWNPWDRPTIRTAPSPPPAMQYRDHYNCKVTWNWTTEYMTVCMGPPGFEPGTSRLWASTVFLSLWPSWATGPQVLNNSSSIIGFLDQKYREVVWLTYLLFNRISWSRFIFRSLIHPEWPLNPPPNENGMWRSSWMTTFSFPSWSSLSYRSEITSIT